jgi:hypothetical protein
VRSKRPVQNAAEHPRHSPVSTGTSSRVKINWPAREYLVAIAGYSGGGQVKYMKLSAHGLGILLSAGLLTGAVPSGPNVGDGVPDFRLQDQDGNNQTLRSILGPKGALLVFYRSADW